MNKSFNISLCIFFVDMYNEWKAKGITLIPKTTVAQDVLLKAYDQLILRDKVMLPIDLLTKEEKEKLVAECREVKDHNYTNETLIRDCKLLHVIKTIKNNV